MIKWSSTYQSETYNKRDHLIVIMVIQRIYLLLMVLNSTNTLSDTQKIIEYIYNPIINQYNGNTYVNRGITNIFCNHRTDQSKQVQLIIMIILFCLVEIFINGIMDEESI